MESNSQFKNLPESVELYQELSFCYKASPEEMERSLQLKLTISKKQYHLIEDKPYIT